MTRARNQELMTKQTHPDTVDSCSKALLANHAFSNIHKIEISIFYHVTKRKAINPATQG